MQRSSACVLVVILLGSLLAGEDQQTSPNEDSRRKSFEELAAQFDALAAHAAVASQPYVTSLADLAVPDNRMRSVFERARQLATRGKRLIPSELQTVLPDWNVFTEHYSGQSPDRPGHWDIGEFCSASSTAIAVYLTGAPPPTEPPPSAEADTKPVAASEYRVWTDNTGKFFIDAALMSVDDGSVTLRKRDGETLAFPSERLSKADQAWIQEKTQPFLLAEWKRWVDGKKARNLLLYSNGHAFNPDDKITWVLFGSTLFVKWPPNKEGIATGDVVTILPNGRAFRGSNTQGSKVRGDLIRGKNLLEWQPGTQ